ncbi:molecular chaperone TorD [Aggregatibacter actinomycetemcomitans D11S-1]|uniref:glycoside hydrolase dispersin B n=1 Tax=Aggregatibacter actinomycetemcomitans TaxID=714 RepID=UPI0001B9F594|nr:glycoside hydrolase dispersin B [Aggregatibacter actinomycetemcomitans]ACX82264.1 molecular chaperone TorD [Aggregatibacter actinomycetemcomitans D11S-1]
MNYIKKIILSLFLLGLFSVLNCCVKGNSIYPQKISTKQTGLMLDIARHFYSPEVIKSFIDTISLSGGNFLHLHFSDHENYAIESHLLNQRAENAVQGKDGIYINPYTGKPFLSYRQLDDIKAYAKAKGIELIPELDSPNHMMAIFKLVQKDRGVKYLQGLKSRQVDDEIDITNADSIAFMQSLMNEVIDIFGDTSQHFHIGGDEFGYSVESNHEFITYANKLSYFLEKKGLKTRMWNDGLIKSTFEQINPNIEITYWSYDGDTQDKNEAAERRDMRVSLPELLAKGFTVLNYNSYYLYIVPKASPTFSQDAAFAAKDVIKNWDLGVWDGRNTKNRVQNTHEIAGAALSIWGEDAKALKDETIQKNTKSLLEAVIHKTNGDE